VGGERGAKGKWKGLISKKVGSNNEKKASEGPKRKRKTSLNRKDAPRGKWNCHTRRKGGNMNKACSMGKILRRT